MEFFASLSVQDDRARLTLRGELDAFTALLLRWRADDALALGSRHFVVDVTDVTFVDAAGLGALVRLHNAAQRLDGSITLIGADEHFRRACDLAGLTEVFSMPAPAVHAMEAAGTG